jgi:hypothetical protein
MPGRLEVLKERRGYAPPTNQGHSPTQSGGAYGRAKPFLTRAWERARSEK